MSGCQGAAHHPPPPNPPQGKILKGNMTIFIRVNEMNSTIESTKSGTAGNSDSRRYLSQPDIDQLTALVGRSGYAAILIALNDILTQNNSKIGTEKVLELAFTLGAASTAASIVDRSCPPSGWAT